MANSKKRKAQIRREVSRLVEDILEVGLDEVNEARGENYTSIDSSIYETHGSRGTVSALVRIVIRKDPGPRPGYRSHQEKVRGPGPKERK